MFIVFSTLIIGLLIFGWFQRHNRKIHIPVMASAFLGDVVLLLVVEFSRGAIAKAATHLSSGLLVFHISVSLVTLGLYIALAILGSKMAKGQNHLQPLHGKLAIAFVVCRLSNYITSFWVTSI